MSKTVKRICLSLALFITLVFVVFVFNQTVQVVHSAREISPVLAKVVEWTLVLFYCILLLTPLVLWLRIPKRIQPPLLAEGIEYERFMETFKKRLSRNPRLRNVPLDLHADVGAALQVLDKHADEAVSSAASAVFLSTAVLQSGRLDVLVVLAAQTRLIWRVAHVYYQRPSLREFLQLYANVTSTAFIAAGLEDVDIDVLVSTVLGSTVASIPGMHLLASSVLTGSANAFLTLRVGMITKEYCRCTTRIEKSRIRRAATVQAAKLLGAIVKEGTVRLAKSAATSTKTKVAKTFNRIVRRRGTSEPEQVS
jgi:hypothetical protein